MIDSNPVHEVCDYGAQALYRELPTIEQIRAGVIPLDSLPAAWWNALWNDTNKAVNEARNAIGVMVNELCNVLVGAGICPSCSCLDQLYQSINKIRQTLATASIPGSVVSSDTCGEVSVNSTTGIMTANGLGNAANLATSARTAVGAINELKQTYDCCINDINTCTGTLNTGKAPVSHASSATTYGVGNATDYGHVRLSDTFASCVGGVAEGVAASQKALYDMYTCITAAGYVTLGNTAGCALGTASAGSASTAARSDHVHPVTGLATVQCVNGYWGLGFAGSYDNYLRTPTSGLIPYASSTTGCGYLGTSSWPFLEVHAKRFCGSFCGTATSATSAGNSTCLGSRSASQYIRNCNGADLGVNANLGTYHTMTTSGPNGCWNHIISMGWGECAGTDTWASQITIPSQNSPARMGYRCHCSNTTNNSWQGWRYLIDTAGGQTIAGMLTACCFCGSFCGTATNASNASNASKLSGYSLSESATGDTVVKRTSAGYVNACIFHDGWAAENISSYTSNVVFRSSDGYLRNTSRDNFRAWLNWTCCACKAAQAVEVLHTIITIPAACLTKYNDPLGMTLTGRADTAHRRIYLHLEMPSTCCVAVGGGGQIAVCLRSPYAICKGTESVSPGASWSKSGCNQSVCLNTGGPEVQVCVRDSGNLWINIYNRNTSTPLYGFSVNASVAY